MTEALRLEVAKHAVDTYIKSGMAIGLGTGRTAKHVIERVGSLMKEGKLKDIKCTPTSPESAVIAKEAGVEILPLEKVLDENLQLDISIDGADEVDPNLALIKGRGAALLQEKIVESLSKVFVVVVDESKLVKTLGVGTIPIEVLKGEAEVTRKRIIKSLKSEYPSIAASLRLDKDGKSPLATAHGNHIVDILLNDELKKSPRELDEQLQMLPGVIETGLFVGMASAVCVSYANGKIVTEKAKHFS